MLDTLICMGRQPDGSILALRATIEHGGVGSWDNENFRWPVCALLLTALAETISVLYLTTLSDLRIAGELARAGGVLLTVLMIASTLARIREWARIADSVPTPLSYRRDDLSTMSDELTLLIPFATILTAAFAVISVFFEHLITQWPMRAVVSCFFSLANISFLLGARNLCRAKLLKAKAVLIVVALSAPDS